MVTAESGKEMLGRNIKSFREARNMSQSELAERLWIDRSSLSGYEIGKRTPDIYMLCRIADELDLPLDVLVGRKEMKDYVRVESVNNEVCEYKKAGLKHIICDSPVCNTIIYI